MKKHIHVISGGTVFHVAPHLALSAPAYGAAGQHLYRLLNAQAPQEYETTLHLTRMAGGKTGLETNVDIADLLDQLVARPETKIIFMPVALCDFNAAAFLGGEKLEVGKLAPRLPSRSEFSLELKLMAAQKVIGRIRRTRKDIFLVGFKTTAGATPDEQFDAGLRLMKESSCNLVLANDVHTFHNMIVTPEQARYVPTNSRGYALATLIDMTLERAQGHFTRSDVREGPLVTWDDARIPANLRKVVDHCLARGAYRPFQGKTVGHFAVKLGDGEYATSIRKSNFNTDLHTKGMVRVVTSGDDKVISFGDRPSVGGQSQRILFAEHPWANSIVHFHCPVRPGKEVPTRSQYSYECGSHECGENTAQGLEMIQDDLGAVMLDNHGPNILFNDRIDADAVIAYIEEHFDLTKTTRGYVQDTACAG